MDPSAMFSSSRKWVAPKVVEGARKDALNKHRKRFCPRSPFWTSDFDLATHKEEYRALKERQNMCRAAFQTSGQRVADVDRLHHSPPRPIREPFDGKRFNTSHSNVLSQPTIFCQQWKDHKAFIAPWPDQAEMAYEGEGRIKTDRIHRRFPGAPRVDGNSTVAWSHRTFIDQYPLENFYYPLPHAVEVFLRTHWVAELEFSDEEGRQSLGSELMDLLDPQDEW